MFTCFCGTTKHCAKGMCRKCYHQNHYLQYREKYKAHSKIYGQRPEAKAAKLAYKQTPKYKAWKKAYSHIYHKTYYQRADVIARIKAYKQNPEVKARMKAYDAGYRQYKAKEKTFHQRRVIDQEFQYLLSLYDQDLLPRHLLLRLETIAEYLGYDLKVWQEAVMVAKG